MGLSKYYSIKRFKNLLFLYMSNLPMPGHKIRPRLVSWGGVDCKNPHTCFIGTNVHFDSVAPERIHIGEYCAITTGVVFLTHYQNSETGEWFLGDVYIGNNVFIGANTIITKAVTIGNNVLIGAGSIVTKDIPDNEVWAGNPARFIRKRKLIK